MKDAIQFSPFTSIFENKAAGTIIIGQPGNGKTYFLITVVSNLLIMNTKIFAIDPKNDLSVLANYFPINVVDVNKIVPGAMNPFRVFRDVNTNAILAVVDIICGGLTQEQNVVISPIVNDFVVKFKRTGEIPNFSDLADYLYANDNINCQAVGTILKMSADSKYGPLLFGESDDSQNEFTKMRLR